MTENNPVVGRIRKAIAARDKAQKALDEHDEKRVKKELNLALEQASVDAYEQRWPDEFELASTPETEAEMASDEELFSTDSSDDSTAF